MKKFIIMAILAAVVVMSLGCISPPEKEEAVSTNVTRRAEKMPGMISTLRIGYQPSTHQIAEMVASEKGWWAEDLAPFGITEIKEFEFPTGVPEMQAMVAGELDIAYVGTAPPISAISAGLPAKIVAAVNINGSNLVLSPDLVYNGPASLARPFHRHIPTRIDSGHSPEELARRKRCGCLPGRYQSYGPGTCHECSIGRQNRWGLPAASNAIDN